MNPRYSALLQLVDYPKKVGHLAVGDLVCCNGRWLRVQDRMQHEGVEGARLVGDDEDPLCHATIWGSLYDIPRIPGPLLELLSQAKDPYR
jgi:hypothetical protein